jgi:hypothetical protein
MMEKANQITLRNLLTELLIGGRSHLGDVVEFDLTRTMIVIKQVMVVLGHNHIAVHTLADLQLGINGSVSPLQDILLGPALSAVA